MSLLFARGAQSVTIDYVIVDIAPTPQFNVTPFTAHVGLSRSRGRDRQRSTYHVTYVFDFSAHTGAIFQLVACLSFHLIG
jgi:hypothetical protein